jgi:hypothetical protein
MKKLQAPRSKLQRSTKIQAPKTERPLLELGAWNFSGARSLELQIGSWDSKLPMIILNP